MQRKNQHYPKTSKCFNQAAKSNTNLQFLLSLSYVVILKKVMCQVIHSAGTFNTQGFC